MIPSPLGELAPVDTIAEVVRRAIREVDLLLVENERSARRLLARLGVGRTLDEVEFHELSEHTRPEELEGYLRALDGGRSVGILSEAGCPGIADPGADLARLCHERGVRVVPLPGPSSIILAVMASGLGGQSFAFHGYLPVAPEPRARRLRELERRVWNGAGTQVFMETPYRNDNLFAAILACCRAETRLCVASSLTTPDEYVRTLRVGAWARESVPTLRKRPALFLLGR